MATMDAMPSSRIHTPPTESIFLGLIKSGSRERRRQKDLSRDFHPEQEFRFITSRKSLNSQQSCLPTWACTFTACELPKAP